MTDVEQATPVSLLRVVRGTPDAAELAALTAVALTLATPAPLPSKRPSSWASPARKVTVVPSPGPGGWRASALPR